MCLSLFGLFVAIPTATISYSVSFKSNSFDLKKMNYTLSYTLEVITLSTWTIARLMKMKSINLCTLYSIYIYTLSYNSTICIASFPLEISAPENIVIMFDICLLSIAVYMAKAYVASLPCLLVLHWYWTMKYV